MAIKRDKNEEEDGGNPFDNVEKTSVLQEARAFNDTSVNPRKCTHILTKVLYLLNQGEQLGTTEATEIFFAMTKLFQSKDVVLRRMVYLGIRELSSIAEDVIIVTSSLTKDMTGSEALYRAAAIRALCSITDSTMLQAIERYMKQAIVDKNAAVSSAALVSSLHLTKSSSELVKRWVNEAQEAYSSDNVMVQYHALGLIYHIRKVDRLAVVKLVTKLASQSSKSPFAVCFLIRVACKLVEESGSEAVLLSFIENCLRHKSELVVYEAARAMISLRGITTRALAPAVSVLQLFCSTSKPVLRFAAVRTLNQVAMTHPSAVTACNLDLENLITDSNRSIATLAITTLLKTGAESSVDRLMKQIASFVNEISDEFKIVVVQAIRALCTKFPRKHAVLMNFLSAMLRDEGGLDYKASIADTLIIIIESNPDVKETGLAHLCEFIEDCEHTSLAVRILHLLGREGPKTKQPSRYIRFIYNRMILENAAVRGAAVAAMARFGAQCPDLLENVQVLLERCQMDSDDEVRDRATYYYTILALKNPSLCNSYITERLQVSIPALERSLHQYSLGSTDVPFDIRSVPLAAVEPAISEIIAQRGAAPEGTLLSKPAPQKLGVSKEESALETISGIPELAARLPELGPIFRTSEPVELTESETEYVVRCIKHCFARHLLVQFECLNTLSDQLLENVRIILEPAEDYNIKILQEVICPRLPYNETASAFCILEFPEELTASTGNISATLSYKVRDCDPTTGEPDSEESYSDTYMIEDFEVTLGDQVQRVSKGNWEAAWQAAANNSCEETDTFALTNMSTLQEATTNIIQFLGLHPADHSEVVPEKQNSSCHTLKLAGVFRGGHDVLAEAKLALVDGVTLHLTVRASNPDVAQLVLSAVG